MVWMLTSLMCAQAAPQYYERGWDRESFCNTTWCNGSLTHPLKHVRWNAAFTNCTHRPPLTFCLQSSSKVWVVWIFQTQWEFNFKPCSLERMMSIETLDSNKNAIQCIMVAVSVCLTIFIQISFIQFGVFFANSEVWPNAMPKLYFTILKYLICLQALISEPSKSLMYWPISYFLRDEEEHRKWGYITVTARLSKSTECRVTADQQKCKLTKEEVTPDYIKCWLKNRICSLSTEGNGQ